MVKEQKLVIKNLQDEIIVLKEEIHMLKRPKDSNTGSVPPSKDENRKTRSLRQKTGKKPGGQPGHGGSTLEMKAVPDEVVAHVPAFCRQCGEDLSGLESTLRKKRQVVDLPVTRPAYTEHRCYAKTCNCGHVTVSEFPDSVRAPVQYGPNIESQVAYLSARQYMPYRRIGEYFRDVCGLPLSEGSVNNLLERFAAKAALAHGRIKENISAAPVVGADETGAKVNGNKFWVHTWQDLYNTFLAISESRGSRAVKENFPAGLLDSILVSDAWAAQLSTPARWHQLCMAHLLRDLNYFIDVCPGQWAYEVKKVFAEAIKLKGRLSPEDYGRPMPERDSLEARLDKLLGSPLDEQHKKVRPFQKRLIKNRGYLFPFLYHEHVPPDNNGSERAIRNVKVKQKISGQFKSKKGGDIFAIVRSVIDTVIKRNGNVFECLNLTANLVPE